MDYRRHIRLTLFAVLFQGLFYLRNLLLLPILTRALGADVFGAWSKLQALAGVLAPLFGLGAPEGLERDLPAAPPAARRIYLRTAVLIVAGGGFLATGLLAATAGPLTRLLALDGGESAALVFGGLGLMMTAGTLALLAAGAYRLTDRPLRYGGVLALQVVLLLAGAWAGAAWFGASVATPIFAWTAGTGLAALLALPGLLRPPVVAPDRVAEPGAPTARAAAERLVKFGAPLLPAGTAVWILHASDRYMLTWLRPDLGNEGVGRYAANYALGGLVALAFGPFWTFLAPAVARLWDAGKPDDAAHLIRQTLKFSAIVMLPVVLSAPVLGDAGIRLFAGEEFRAAPLVIFLVMVGYFCQMLAETAALPLQMERRTTRLFLHAALAAGANIGLNLLLIPRRDAWGGLTGAALATALSFGLFLGLNRAAARDVAGGVLGAWALLRAAAAAGAGAGVVRCWHATGAGELAAALATGGVVYATLLFAFGVVRPAEIRVVAGAVAAFFRPADDDTPPADASA